MLLNTYFFTDFSYYITRAIRPIKMHQATAYHMYRYRYPGGMHTYIGDPYNLHPQTKIPGGHNSPPGNIYQELLLIALVPFLNFFLFDRTLLRISL